MKSCFGHRKLPARKPQAAPWIVGASVLTLVCCVASRAAPSAQSWRIDEARTSIGFKIDAVGFPTTRGRFVHYSGRIRIDFDHPADSFTTFTVDSSSIDVGSRSFNDFVKSAALLNVARFPTLSFTSTRIEKIDSHTASVKGALTMLGVTKPIMLTVNVITNRSAARDAAFSASGTIKRSEFGMIFGIPLIDDSLEIIVTTRALSDG
jgi:polyisoprenoid-binding protein YceI